MKKTESTARALSACLLAGTLAAVLWSCGGGKTGKATVDSVIPTAEAVRIIESRPATFDARSLEDMDRAIASGAVPGSEDIARMLVAAEAGAGHLQSMLDDLARNEDPADTYGLLTELAGRPWTRALVAVTRFLTGAPLSGAERSRALDLAAAIGRSRLSVLELETSQLGGTPTGLAQILTVETNQ